MKLYLQHEVVPSPAGKLQLGMRTRIWSGDQTRYGPNERKGNAVRVDRGPVEVHRDVASDRSRPSLPAWLESHLFYAEALGDEPTFWSVRLNNSVISFVLFIILIFEIWC